MKAVIIGVLLLIVACVLVAGGADAPLPSTGAIDDPAATNFVGATVRSRFLGTNLLSKISYADIRATPHWTGEERPPLLPRSAELRAARYLNSTLMGDRAPDTYQQNWHIHDLKLRRWYGTDLWYFEISALPVVDGRLLDAAITVFVTLDGEVCPLRVMPGESGAARPTR